MVDTDSEIEGAARAALERRIGRDNGGGSGVGYTQYIWSFTIFEQGVADEDAVGKILSGPNYFQSLRQRHHQMRLRAPPYRPGLRSGFDCREVHGRY